MEEIRFRVDVRDGGLGKESDRTLRYLNDEHAHRGLRPAVSVPLITSKYG